MVRDGNDRRVGNPQQLDLGQYVHQGGWQRRPKCLEPYLGRTVKEHQETESPVLSKLLCLLVEEDCSGRRWDRLPFWLAAGAETKGNEKGPGNAQRV